MSQTKNTVKSKVKQQSRRERLRVIKNKVYQRGVIAGEQHYKNLMIKQSKEHKKQIIEITTDFDKQLIENNKNYRKELSLVEKEYAIKTNVIDKKIKRLDALIREWENKTTKAGQILKSTHEINSQVKQKLYQNRKELAGAEDDDKTMRILEAQLEESLRKTTLAKSNVNDKVSDENVGDSK